jgi:hypothetical protein
MVPSPTVKPVPEKENLGLLRALNEPMAAIDRRDRATRPVNDCPLAARETKTQLARNDLRNT